MNGRSALIIVSHGSRVETANEEMIALTRQIEIRAREHFTAVAHAFLEISGPGPSEQIARLVQAGVERIVVFPLFLAAGKHVNQDLPEIVAEAKKTYPGVSFYLAAHLGSIERIPGLILDSISSRL